MEGMCRLVRRRRRQNSSARPMSCRPAVVSRTDHPRGGTTMSTVLANMSMSLDGFIEDRHGNAPTHLLASADVVRQCLELGLLEGRVVTPGEGVTHMRYRVKR